MKKNSVLLSIILLLSIFASCGEGLVLEASTDLAILRVGAVSDTAGAVYASQCGSENVLLYDDIDAAANALSAGEIDCVITDPETAKDTASAREDLTTTETRIIEDTEFCAAVRSTDFDTLAVAEVVTTEVEKETNFTKLCRGFVENLGAERDAFITEAQTGSSGTLILGTTAGYPPYAYTLEDGSVAGISIELAKRFAQKRDHTLEVRVYESEAELSKALKANEIDIYFEKLPVPAVAGVTYTSACYTVELRILIRG